MFHLTANFAALANVANTEIAALQDDVLQIRNNRHIPYEDMMAVALYSGAVTLLRTRINTPNVRKIAPSMIVPVNALLLPGTDPNFADMRSNPFRFRRDEGIVYESTDSAAGPNNHYILGWLTTGLEQPPNGDVYTVRGVSTTAAVASTWTTVATTWDQDLTEGQYAVIGGMYVAANAVAFQCIFEQQTYRPGGLGGATAGVRPPWPQLNGGFGTWGRFRSINPPIMRVLNDGTDASHTFFLNVVRVGGAPLN